MNIEIYTDGSSMHNGKPDCVGGWSACYVMGKKKYIRYGHLPAPSSNNRGEIYGVLYTIMTFVNKPDWKLHIYSDSQYVVKSINEWRHKWKKKNYDGVMNADLVLPMFDAWDKHGNAEISWVKGHMGNAGNELADEFAGCGMRNIDRTMKSDYIDIVKVEEVKYAGNY